MPVSKEQIKKALDHFENDEFSEAQDILRQEIRNHRDEWLDQKLGLVGEQDEEHEKDESEEEEKEEEKKAKKKGKKKEDGEEDEEYEEAEEE